jgi:hypothetical protein
LIYTAVEMPFGKSDWKDLGLATVGIGTTFTPIAGDGAAAGAKVSYRVNKVAAKSAAAKTPRSLFDALAKGKQPHVRTVKTPADLTKLHSELTKGGTPMNPGTYPGTVIKAPDGTIIRMRPGSKSGGGAIDITFPDGTINKVHIE